jgi:predicted HD superfamily hydrolase involved in NAD metabolism
LAARHDVDPGPVDLGAATHDLARATKGGALLAEALRHGVKPHPVEEQVPMLLHGTVAALWLEHRFAISDQRVIEAVRWHSTGKSGMGSVARVVFLADKLDPEKVRRYPYLDEIRTLATESMDRAILEFLNRSLAHLIDGGALIHPESLKLRNELIIAQDV